MNQPTFSVILCSHNPRRVYLERVLAALRAQTLPIETWELIIVDNGSTPAIASFVALDWHPNSCIVVEKAIGLTNARLRGIASASGTVLVFVDDDNVLSATYLENALKIADRFPCISVWGGSYVGEFECPVAAELLPYLPLLCVDEIQRDYWGNTGGGPHMPNGAGMCVRRHLALEYDRVVRENGMRRKLDRTGQSLDSGGDTDLVLLACDMGFGAGRFHSMILKHLIPMERSKLPYLLRLAESVAASGVLVDALRDRRQKHHRLVRLVISYLWSFFQPYPRSAFVRAHIWGALRGCRRLSKSA